MAEAGFFPGIIYYLTRWFPIRERARTIAAFMTATLIAGVIGGPLSGALLSFHGVGGLAGWQWLFLLEGLPAVVLGVVVLKFLTERPEEAMWLSDAERATLVACLSEDARAQPAETTARALGNRPDVAARRRLLHHPGDALRHRLLAAADAEDRVRRQRPRRSAS